MLISPTMTPGRRAAMGRLLERGGRPGQAVGWYMEAARLTDSLRKHDRYLTLARAALSQAARKTS